VSDDAFFDQLVAAAAAQPSAVYSTGGNAALMANRLADLGSRVFLGGSIGPRLASLLHKSISHKGGEGVKDEVHLILEYAPGESWGQLTSPRSNRFIAVHDETNSQLLALEEFHATMLSEFKPAAIILAGLHLLEGQPEQVRRERVDAAKRAIEKTAQSTVIHFELASIANEEFLSLVATELISNVDSLGLNEQELGALVQSLGTSILCSAECQATIKQLDMAAFTAPSVHTVSKAVQLVFQVLSHKDPQKRLLSRIHFHYLTYHVVAERQINPASSEKWLRWGTGFNSVLGGSLGGAARACGDGMWDVDPADVEPRLVPETLHIQDTHATEMREVSISANPDQPITTWQEGEFIFHLAPVLVCKGPIRTVGLGDVISSTGLLYALAV